MATPHFSGKLIHHYVGKWYLFPPATMVIPPPPLFFEDDPSIPSLGPVCLGVDESSFAGMGIAFVLPPVFSSYFDEDS